MLNEHVYDEIKAMAIQWPIWFMLATQDIKLRYTRSSIGPIWATIRTAITIYTTGFLYGHLFKTNLNEYLPYIASGIIGWGFINTLIVESSSIYIESARYIKNQEVFLSVFMVRLVVRNLIVLFHNLIAFIPILLFFNVDVGWNTLMLLPNLIMISLNGIFWGTLLALIGARFRDFSQIMSSLLQIIFFITPVIWMPRFLSEQYQWVLHYNFLNYFLMLLRNPLMNLPVSGSDFLIQLLILAVGFVLYLLCIKRYKYNVVFWL